MKKYVCTVCGYIAEGSIPEQCPVCKAPASAFVEKTGNTYVTEHVVGIGKAEGVPQEIVDGLRANFEGECSEVSVLAGRCRALIRKRLMTSYISPGRWMDATSRTAFGRIKRS